MRFKKDRHFLQIAAFCMLTVVLFITISAYKVSTAPLAPDYVSAVDTLQATVVNEQGGTAAAIDRYREIGNVSRGDTTIRKDLELKAAIAAAATPTPAPTPVPTPVPTPIPTPAPAPRIAYVAPVDPIAPMDSIVSGAYLAPSEAGRPVIFLGDSLTVDAVSAINQFWEFSSVFHQYNLVNMAVNGSTTKAAMSRVWDLVAQKPRTVFIMIGTNDMYGGENIYTSLNNVAYIVDTIRGNVPDCTIVIQTIPPFGDLALARMWAASNYNVSVYNQGLRNLAVDRGVSFVDIGAMYRNANGVMDSAYTNDGVHITVYNDAKWLRKLIALGFV
jgi:lysophospholipase L1-like esterase